MNAPAQGQNAPRVRPDASAGSAAARARSAHRSRVGPAQLVWIALPGPDIDDTSRGALQRGAGGVVLFSRNITGAAQLRQLTSDLHSLSAGPLLIAIDHEGGHVARIGAPLTRFPSAMAVAATGSPELAREVARAAGLELAEVGIDVNLAPVVDVLADASNPSVGARAFGASPERVAEFGVASVRGLREAGIAATAKHFPGNGRTPIDPHLALPRLAGGREALQRHDLLPFTAVIEAGVDAVMVSHAAIDGLTDGLPSTLSPAVVSGLLRAELGFDGLVLSDAMSMSALTGGHRIAEACLTAIDAGLDIVVPIEDQAETLTAVEEAFVTGRLPPARLSATLARLQRLHARLEKARAARPPVPLPVADHLELARRVARESLTLLHGHDVLPLAASTSVAVIEFASRRPSPVEERLSEVHSLGAALRRYMPRLHEVVVGGAAEPAGGEQAAVAAAGSAEFVLLATRDAYLWPEERALVERLMAAGRPTMLIALRNPYDLVVLPRPTVAAAAYADVPATLEALAQAISGRAGWPGRLPLDFGARTGS